MQCSFANVRSMQRTHGTCMQVGGDCHAVRNHNECMQLSEAQRSCAAGVCAPLAASLRPTAQALPLLMIV